MTLSELTSPDAVVEAVEEFDQLGREGFLAKYQFGHAQRYFVRRDGRLYDSKAIAGAAFGFQYPDRGPMAHTEFAGGENTVKKRLEDLGFEVVAIDGASVPDGELTLPQSEVHQFSEVMRTDFYAADERDYKVAVHEVLSRLLSPPTIERPEFPSLLAAFFSRQLDLAAIGIEGELAKRIEAAVGGAAPYRVTNAFVNLAGGGFAVNNFIWIPAAVEHGLGEQVRESFRALVTDEVDLAERVEAFRSALYSIEEQSKAAGGFKPGWNLIRISLAFTAALLAAFDPSRYTPYHQRKLRKSYEEFIGPWPKQQGGSLYATLCTFVQAVKDALIRQGAEPRDLIDAQSFLWLRAEDVPEEEAMEEEQAVSASAESHALHLVAKWSPQHGADTVQLHQDVLSTHDSVWWGVIGTADKKKISDGNLDRIRAQLDGGVDTFVYLAGPATAPIWRTRLIDIGTERPQDSELIPSYYPSSLHHSLWLKLSDFTEVRRDDLMRTVEPYAHSGKLIALTNQTNPLLVSLRAKPRVWFVTQGDSFQRARAGGYLWAPLLDKAGHGREHWESLRYARSGDLVLSHADGVIRAVSRVVDLAYPATRPDPEADQAWSDEGQRLDVVYTDLVTPLPISAIPEGDRRAEGGPFDKNGAVKQAYFFPLSDAFVNVVRRLSPELAALLPTADETVDLVVGTSYQEPPFEEIVQAVLAERIVLTLRTIRRYHLSLKTRGFVVLSGVSGTGKTWLAQAYARAVGAKFDVVPVAPNWTTNEDLLGYLSPIDGKYRDTQFSRFLRAADREWRSAKAANRSAQPYHVILDEMNLARVEYYFAKFLSAMELRAREGEAQIELAPDDVVTLGPNLFFAGTVNIDETTHLFADKVFDRAQLVELSVDRPELEQHIGDQPYADILLQIWDALSDVAPFAYRIIDEIGVYIAHAEQLDVSWQEALDEEIFQKILPKLKGADPRVGDALEQFITLTDGNFPLSQSKAQTMLEGFLQHGFSSYF